MKRRITAIDTYASRRLNGHCWRHVRVARGYDQRTYYNVTRSSFLRAQRAQHVIAFDECFVTPLNGRESSRLLTDHTRNTTP